MTPYQKYTRLLLFKNPLKSSTVHFTPFHRLLPPFTWLLPKLHWICTKNIIQFIIQYWILEPSLFGWWKDTVKYFFGLTVTKYSIRRFGYISPEEVFDGVLSSLHHPNEYIHSNIIYTRNLHLTLCNDKYTPLGSYLITMHKNLGFLYFNLLYNNNAHLYNVLWKQWTVIWTYVGKFSGNY